MTVASKKPYLGLGLVCLCALLSGFFSANDYKIGGKEYPSVNPVPNHVFLVRGTLASALPVEFDAIYGVTKRSCMYKPWGSALEGAGVQAPDASFPLELKRDGDLFSVAVAMDGVLPGKCGWSFRGVIARATSENIFHGGLMASGQWVVSNGWSPHPAQPSPNPAPIVKKCVVPSTSGDDAKYGPGQLSCGMTVPWATVSEQTTSVELHLSEGQWWIR